MTNVIRRSDEGNYIFSEKLLPGIKEENLRFIVSVQHPQGHTRKKKKKNFFFASQLLIKFPTTFSFTSLFEEDIWTSSF